MSTRDCPFLDYVSSGIFSSGYCCRVTGERILTGSALHKNYCTNWESGYSTCPHFTDGRGNRTDSGSGCYLSSACATARGLPDDCHELTVLRRFRDEWLSKQAGGTEEIAEYYRIAPKIVEAINAQEDVMQRWETLYAELVIPCVELIDASKYEAAHELYREATLRLKQEYDLT